MEADFGGQVERPEAGLAAKAARAAMEQGPQALGGLRREGRIRLVGERRAVLQGVQSAVVEGMQGIEHRLVVAAEFLRNAGRAFAASAG